MTSLVSGGERTEYRIGASDTDEGDAWRWIDGTSLDGYNNWLEGEPNGGTKENYAVVFTNTGKWNDEYANKYNTKGVASSPRWKVTTAARQQSATFVLPTWTRRATP